MRKILIFTIALAIALSAAACGRVEESAASPSAAAEQEPEENTDIVAVVNDELILLEEVTYAADSALTVMGFEKSEYSDEELLELYNGILDELIYSALERQQAEKMGYAELDEKDAALAQSYVENELAERYEHFYDTARAEAGENADEDRIGIMTAQLIADYVADTKETDEYLLRKYSMSIAVENMYAELTAELDVSDDEMQLGYEERVEQDRQTYTEHEDYFASDRTTNLLYYNLPGYRYVKHIMVSDEEKANEILALTQGTDFDNLIIEYSEDTGSEGFENGYAVCRGCEEFGEEFVNAAMALEKPGDISGIVKEGGFWHIIKYVSDIKEGPVSFEEVKDDLYEELLFNKTEEYKSTVRNEWKKEADIKLFPEIFGL